MSAISEFGVERKPAYIWLFISGAVILLLGMVFGGVEGSYLFGERILAPHMVLNAASGVMVFASLVTGFREIRKRPAQSIIMWAGMLGLAANGVFGVLITQHGATPLLSGLHFFLATVTLGMLSAGSAFALMGTEKSETKNYFGTRFGRHSLLAVGLVIIALASSVFLSRSDLTFSNLSNGLEGLNWINLAHQISVAAIGIYLIYFNRMAWRKHRSSRLVLTFANLLVVLYLAQGFVGALKLAPEALMYLDVLHKLTGAVLAVVGGILVSATAFRVENENESRPATVAGTGQRVKDFMALTKPVVVLLLLATTFGGMVMGARGLPGLDVIVVTLVSGALAAGGSGAVNQYLDRDLDGVMARTSQRPIPSGRLTSAEGLAFGVTAIVAAFYLLAGFVNILAALLTLAGMLYYVILYSILLKKRTVQNIVIGGGAGAVPPLVGWAAATGSLDLTAGFLFLIIFLWTPPHFWALALTRSNEYQDAGVPMMPVEKGEHVTRKLIFQYTIVLVLSTIVMWALGLAGWLFLVIAVLLGGYLVWLAFKVWRSGRNRVYYKMYRHSNYYLLLLFIVLAIDSVLLGS